MQNPKKQVKRYRVLRVNMSKTLNPGPIEDWLNEGSDDHYMYDIIREDGIVLFIQAIPCRRVKRWRVTKLPKTKAPAKKKTATKKTAAKKK